MAKRSSSKKSSKAKKSAKRSLADDAKGRFGFLVLFFAAIFLIIANIMFYQKGAYVLGLDVGKTKDTFGWMMLLFSMFLSTATLCIAITMTSRKKHKSSTPY